MSCDQNSERISGLFILKVCEISLLKLDCKYLISVGAFVYDIKNPNSALILKRIVIERTEQHSIIVILKNLKYFDNIFNRDDLIKQFRLTIL